MLKKLLFLTGAIFSCAWLLSGCTQPADIVEPADAAGPAIVVSDIITKRGTVLAVDRAQRTVILRGEDGAMLGLVLDERVTNLNQIEVGDEVTTQYHDATLIFVRPATGAPKVTTDRALLRTARPGEKPEVSASRTREATSTIENIDRANRLVTLRGRGGETRTLRIAPQVEDLDAIEPGDEVVVRHTEAIAIAVTK